MSPFRLSVRAIPAHPESRMQETRRGAAGADVPLAPVRVPWRVVRRALGVIEVEHRGEAPAYSVRFALSGAGVLGLSLPRTVHPGERLRIAVWGAAANEAASASDAMLVLRWYEPDGTELLWPIAVD